MATLTIRNLPEETRRALKARAAEHNRSMEAEVRDILVDAVVARTDFISPWIVAVELDAGDLELPPRSAARPIDLS